jgi:biotin carboxyl carrier protein
MVRQRTSPVKAAATPEQTGPEVVSIAQLKGLVQLLDRSDIVEIEVKREELHLVLRKAQTTVPGASSVVVAAASNGHTSIVDVEETRPTAALETVKAALVGTFHPWLKPKSGTLVAVGDLVKPGQVVGTIEALNVLNEVEVSVAGRVIEILAQDGQPVEYGQALLKLDPAEVA